MQLLNIVEVAEPGYPLSVSWVISELECSGMLSSPVDSDPLILCCVSTPDSIQLAPSIL